MAFLTHFLSVCLSALGFSYALPNEMHPSGVPIGGFICLVPFFYALQTTGYGKKGVFYLSFTFGIVFHATSSWWLANFKDYAVWTLGATSVFYGFFYGIWGLLLHHAGKTGTGRPFLAALVWTVMEWQKSIGYFAFPWGLLP